MQPQPLPSPPNRAKAFNGPPPDSHHSRRSKVSFNLVNIPDEEHEDTHPQHNFQVSGASESQIDTQWAETPSLTRAQNMAPNHKYFSVVHLFVSVGAHVHLMQSCYDGHTIPILSRCK
eukprot:scaffold271986_cov19-Tisochrysis_lutea.AAC.1